MLCRPLLHDIPQRWVQRLAIFPAIQRRETRQRQRLVDTSCEVREPLTGQYLWWCRLRILSFLHSIMLALSNVFPFLAGPPVLAVVKAFGQFLTFVRPTHEAGELFRSIIVGGVRPFALHVGFLGLED